MTPHMLGGLDPPPAIPGRPQPQHFFQPLCPKVHDLQAVEQTPPPKRLPRPNSPLRRTAPAAAPAGTGTGTAPGPVGAFGGSGARARKALAHSRRERCGGAAWGPGTGAEVCAKAWWGVDPGQPCCLPFLGGGITARPAGGKESAGWTHILIGGGGPNGVRPAARQDPVRALGLQIQLG